MKIFLIGSLAYDRVGRFKGSFSDVIKKEHLEKLSVSFYVEDQETFFGGTAGNIAYSLGLLEVPATLACVLGDDGEIYESKLKGWNMDVSNIDSIKGPSANATIVSDSNENQITFFAPGVIVSAPDFELPKDASEGDILLVTPENSLRMKQAVQLGKEKGLQVFFDPGQQIHTFDKETLEFILEKSDGLFVNDYEWELVLSITGLGEEELCKKLKTIFHTKGADGIWLIQDGVKEHIEARKIDKVGDPTGAGDAFRAGVLAGLYKSLSFKDSARVGAILGALCAREVQTQAHVIPDSEIEFLENFGFSLGPPSL